MERIEGIALSEARLLGSLVSESGVAAGIEMLFTLDINDQVAMGATIQAIENIKQEISSRYPTLELYDTGFVTMMHHMSATVAADARSIYSISLMLILIFLIWFFHSFSAAISVLFIGILSVAASVGFLGLVGGYLTPPTAMALLMVLILGLVDGIHVVKSAGRFLAAGVGQKEAISQSIASNMVPTAVGFLSFNLNDFLGIQILGNYVAFGVMLAFVLTLTLLPAMLCYCKLG